MARVEETNNGKMKRKLYEKELRKLQVELCHLHDWAKAKGLRVIVLLARGAGGDFAAITETRIVVPLAGRAQQQAMREEEENWGM
jgi:polyphosphate kinase 2 (PPK2 family)